MTYPVIGHHVISTRTEAEYRALADRARTERRKARLALVWIIPTALVLGNGLFLGLLYGAKLAHEAGLL